MQRETARLWREGARWLIQLDIDGVPYTERDYADIASAAHAMTRILRQQAERLTDIDAECDTCEGPLDCGSCSQRRASGFVRTCPHGTRPIRMIERAAFCVRCRA
jgi:hypothetical protein